MIRHYTVAREWKVIPAKEENESDRRLEDESNATFTTTSIQASAEDEVKPNDAFELRPRYRDLGHFQCEQLRRDLDDALDPVNEFEGDVEDCRRAAGELASSFRELVFTIMDRQCKIFDFKLAECSELLHWEDGETFQAVMPWSRTDSDPGWELDYDTWLGPSGSQNHTEYFNSCGSLDVDCEAGKPCCRTVLAGPVWTMPKGILEARALRGSHREPTALQARCGIGASATTDRNVEVTTHFMFSTIESADLEYPDESFKAGFDMVALKLPPECVKLAQTRRNQATLSYAGLYRAASEYQVNLGRNPNTHDCCYLVRRLDLPRQLELKDTSRLRVEHNEYNYVHEEQQQVICNAVQGASSHCPLTCGTCPVDPCPDTCRDDKDLIHQKLAEWGLDTCEDAGDADVTESNRAHV
jgi:hypothetical protein